MKITVELVESDIERICQITGERRKGPAVRQFIVHSLQIERRRVIASRFIEGEWGVDLEGFEQMQST
jgi:hypothetical protein